jgi:hypothetical protein
MFSFCNFCSSFSFCNFFTLRSHFAIFSLSSFCFQREIAALRLGQAGRECFRMAAAPVVQRPPSPVFT